MFLAIFVSSQTGVIFSQTENELICSQTENELRILPEESPSPTGTKKNSQAGVHYTLYHCRMEMTITESVQPLFSYTDC